MKSVICASPTRRHTLTTFAPAADQIRIDGSDLSDEYVAKFIQRGRLKMWNPATRKWRSIIPFMFDVTETSRDEVARVLKAYYTKYVGYTGEILFVKWY